MCRSKGKFYYNLYENNYQFADYEYTFLVQKS